MVRVARPLFACVWSGAKTMHASCIIAILTSNNIAIYYVDSEVVQAWDSVHASGIAFMNS